MEIKNGLLFLDGKQVDFVATPNKRGTMVPSYLIMHYTGDSKPSSTIGWFKDKSAQASAHILIDREGHITQFGLFTEVLWHAGKSEWKGIVGLNSHSIGIELTNLGNVPCSKSDAIRLKYKNQNEFTCWQTFTDKQIDVAEQLAELLVKTYHLKDILGHDDIAPGRKIDPGAAFPWERFKLVTTDHSFTTTSDLNLRSGAGTDQPVLIVVPKGSHVKELSRSGYWSGIEFSGVKGFVSNKYLS